MAAEWQCIANNEQTGVSTWILDDGEDVHIQTRQDVSKLLDENTAIRNVTESGWKGDGMHSVARVPLAMLHDNLAGIGQAVREQDDAYIAKVLNDGDYSKLRTKEGNI